MRKLRRKRQRERGLALLIALILISVLSAAGVALATLASRDSEMAGSDRRSSSAREAAESGLNDVLGDERTLNNPADSDPGFAPDPTDPTLYEDYPAMGLSGGQAYDAQIQFVRYGGVEESSAIQTRSLVYNIEIEGQYQGANGRVMNRKRVSAEFFRVVPGAPGVVTKPRHHQ